MNNKIFRYLIIAAAIAILIFLAVSIYRARKPTPSVSQQPSPPTTEATSQTRLEVPKNITEEIVAKSGKVTMGHRAQ